jgi:hypothetical protein
MQQIALSQSQKDVIRRYVEVWRRWRPGIRGFADLERDMENCFEVLADGITVDNRPDQPVIAADAKDQRFHAAIFADDDDAVSDMTSEELEQLRRYILDGNRTLPIRKWRRPKQDTDASMVTRGGATAEAAYAQG